MRCPGRIGVGTLRQGVGQPGIRDSTAGLVSGEKGTNAFCRFEKKWVCPSSLVVAGQLGIPASVAPLTEEGKRFGPAHLTSRR
jgi:hypothetical protein